MICPNCKTKYPFGHKFCPTCEDEKGMPIRLIDEQQTAGGFNLNLGDANAISGGVNLSDSHNDNSQHFDQRGQTNYNAQGGITITNQAAQTTEQDVVLKKEDRYRAACRRVYEDFVIDDVEIKQLKGLAQDLGLSDDRALSILNGVKQQMDAERAREEALNPRAQKRLQRLLSSMRENDVDAVIEQLESFDEMVTEKNISELHFVYYLAQAALNHKKCIALVEKSVTDSYWRSYWSYVAYIKNGHKKEATKILDRIETKFSDYSADNTALLASVGELMLGNRKAADNEFLDVDESKLSPRLQRLFEALLLNLDPAEAKENNLREKDYLFYIKHIFNSETTEEREKREREERMAREAEECRLRAEAEAKRKAEERARIKAEQEAQRKREEEERKRKEAEEERKRKEAEAKRKREEEERKRAEERKRKEEEARRRAAEAEAKRKAEEEARRKAAEEARRKEEAERKRKEAEAKQRREEEYRRRMEEARAKAELEAKRRAEDKSTITVSKTSLTFPADGGSETVEINASGFWRLSAVPDNWAIVEEHTNSIVVKAMKNDVEKERTDYLKIKCGNKEVRVDIRQEANEQKTYILKITKVTNLMRAMATARAVFGWDVGTSRTKFCRLPLTVKMENKQEAFNLYNKLSNGGMEVNASSVTTSGRTINNCF